MPLGHPVRYLAVFLLLFLGSAFLSAQDYHLTRRFTTEDGLAGIRGRDGFMDSKGYLWVSTTNGLSRYDGTTFRNFYHDPSDPTSLCWNNTNGFFEDDEGYLWIGTDKGLAQFDHETETFTCYTNAPNDSTSISGDIVQGVFQDSEKQLWVFTHSAGINLFHKKAGTFKPFLIKKGISVAHNNWTHNTVNSITEDIENRDILWLAGHRNGPINLINPQVKLPGWMLKCSKNIWPTWIGRANCGWVPGDIFMAMPASENLPKERTLPAWPQNEKPLLLIIEDNLDVIEYLQACLGTGYRFLTARNGREGVETALEKIPDIVISDVMMPEMDGFEVCEKLKNDPRTSHVPIILLTDFNARIENDQTLLTWNTASETNNRGFYLQKIKDGRAWAAFGFVEGHGTSIEQHRYSFLDKTPFEGLNYYRLRQMDFDGGEAFSPVRSIGFRKEKGGMSIRPNPFNDRLYLEIPDDVIVESVRIFNLLGQLVFSTKDPFQSELNLGGLTTGHYLLEVRAEGQPYFHKIIKRD